jgi:ubiquinone/menaquinone biosynthesis C-methylase UbiE
MNFYEKYCLPRIINLGCNSHSIRIQRRKVVPLAEGRVLEVGMGPALNLPFYNADRVEFIWGLEPSEGMRGYARRNLERTSIEVKWIALPGEEIPLEDNSADTVLLTFALCTIPDWHRALLQMRRVLKPEGKLIFCEHGVAPDETLRKWQERVNPFWKRIAGGCQITRPIPRYIADSGFKIQKMESGYVPGVPKIAGFQYWGTANKN